MPESSILEKASDVRWDERKGRPLRVRGEFALPAGDSAEDAVKAFLGAHADELRLGAGAENLHVIQDVSTPTRRVVRLQQTQDGIPILGAVVVAQLDPQGNVRQLDLGHEADTRAAAPAGDQKLTPKAATKAATESLGAVTLRQKIAKPEEIYFPTDQGLRLAFMVLIPTREPAHDWRVLVDAYSGDILAKEDLLVRLPDGQGFVFDPNPVVTAHNNLLRDPDATLAGCGFSGNTRATLDAQRVTRTLKDLTHSGGHYKLEGPYVKLRNFGAPNIAPPEETGANNFTYSSGDPGFEAVMVYYHVDSIQRYIQSLGVATAHNHQIEADAHDGSGGAWFSPIDGGIHFGNSGPCRPDRGEEADAIVHEYGHAIQRDQVPGWGGTSPVTGRRETRAMGEGFGDILACVYFAERGGGYQREVFEDWVFGDVGGLRRVDGTKVYPTDWVNEEHGDGEIWSAALWNIYRAIGGDSANPAIRRAAGDALLKSLILSHHSVAANATMPDGAEALMETHAELDDFRGKHLMEMLDSFHDRGLLRCDPNADLYIRDAVGDPGADSFTGPVFWNSPDLWIRNANDNSTAHQNPEFGQDNWFHARVRNRGTATARAFVVTFNVKTWAGTQFVYPADFVPFISATVGFNLAPGASTVVKAKWPAALVPPAGTHACWLASVYMPTDVSPAGKHVWEHNNLAQKNLTVVDLVPGDSVTVPVELGNRFQLLSETYRIEVRRPSQWRTAPVSIVHRDPTVVRELFKSIEEHVVAPAEPRIEARPLLRFLEPGRIELIHRGLALEPVRFTLGRDSMVDVGGGVAVESVSEPAADEGLQADLVSDPVGLSAIRFRPGLLTGLPVWLKARNPIKVGLKVTAPPEAKPGDQVEVHLLQRNRQGRVVGGITVQVNVVER